MAVYSTQTGSFTLTAAATKSLWLLNPVTDSFKIAEWGVSFDNVTTSAEPVLLELYRVTTIGTPTGTTATINAWDPSEATPTTTGLVQLTAEPTAVAVLAAWYVSPNAGAIVLQYPLGREPKAAAAGARLGMRYTTVTGVTPKADAYVAFDE